MARISSVRAHSTSGGATPFAAQPVQHAREVQRVAFEQRLAEVEHVVARDVEHRVAHLLERDPARREEERELLHLLPGGEEIAFDAVGDELERLPVRFLALRLQPAGEPLGQRLARDGLRLDHDAGALERLEPAPLSAPASRGRGGG